MMQSGHGNSFCRYLSELNQMQNKHFSIRLTLSAILVAFAASVPFFAQTDPRKANLLRGEYGRYRANNDLINYNLSVRIDPVQKTIKGTNTIKFKMLKDDNRIQLDLYDNLNVDKIAMGSKTLKYTRELGTVYVDFPQMLKAGKVYSIDFGYSGTPKTTGRFGGFVFGTDPKGRPWIFTACEGEGASIWWPNKDTWHDEVENMKLSVAIPSDLVDASNGRFIGKKDLGDGYARWDWMINYPINNYNVSVNIGKYEHFSDKYKDLTLDFYAQPEDLDKAKTQFAQAKGMIEAFEHYFGEYPFKKDGYKLIQVPYSGMEHQSAVTYGNLFENGYLKRDWTGVGISPKFDFIIIHESGHEWFGNAVSAADRADMWIQEGWTTYLECLFVEYSYGHDDYMKYTNAYVKKIQNRTPIIPQRGINATPPQDMYFKGALFIHTLRSIVDDDKKWFAIMKDFFQKFKYQNIMTEDVEAFFSERMGRNMKAVFDQYLRRAAVPKLELQILDFTGRMSYRWKADEPGFDMPVKVGTKNNWTVIYPTTVWKSMDTAVKLEDFQVATDLFYVEFSKVEAQTD